MRPERIRVDGFSVEMVYIRFVENELRRYPARKQRLSKLLDEPLDEDDILHGTNQNIEPGMPKSPNVGRPTESAALALVQRRRKLDERSMLAAQVRMVQEVFDTLTPDLQSVIKTVYFDGLYTVEGAAKHLGFDRKTVRHRAHRALIPFVLVIVGDYAVQNEIA